jgi:hypothetical protein
MGLLQVAKVEQSAAKIGIFGPGGSGKSLTTTLIAIALSKVFHNNAPVALMDTERASDWLIPIYEIEKVPFIRMKTRSFSDMQEGLREAEAAKACAFNVDSYSAPWSELQATLKKRLNVRKLEFHHMQELQEMWGGWVQQFLNSPLHCILSGRLAYEWENETDVETGKMGFHKSGTKMRAEKDAGYEPHMLIELEAVRQLEKERKVGAKRKRTELKAGGHFVHRMHVLKDRAMSLNGLMFEFKDINHYKEGDWKQVYKALEPHFAKMNIGGQNVADAARSSAHLFNGRGDGAEFGRKKDIALEEIRESIAAVFPGQTAGEKKARQIILEDLFGTLSWTKVEASRLDRLELAVKVLVQFRRQVAGDMDRVSSPEGIVAALKTARDVAEMEPDDDMPLPAAKSEQADAAEVAVA